MRGPSIAIFLGLGVAALTSGSGCESDHDDPAPVTSGSATGGGGAGGDSTGGGGSAPGPRGYGYYFSVDGSANAWGVTVVDPTAADPVIATLSADDLSALSGPAGNDQGPAWGDAVASPDGSRVFVNASSVDRVAVIETDTPSFETLLTVGGRPLHIFNPNHNGEAWAHNDADGTFHVIDMTTLSLSGPVDVGLAGTGHGKLLYAEQLGTHYFATNTNDPGAWSIDGATQDTTFIELCAQPCADDPNTPEDESLLTCGGTHDKTYDAGTDTAIFQCSGATGGHVAFVDPATLMVTGDLVPMVVSAFAHSPDHRYVLVFDNDGDAVNVWDGDAEGHSLADFDATVTITGNASGRGTDFRQNGEGAWEAWIPQSQGTKLVVLNLASFEATEIEIGALSPAPGESHFTRRGGIGGDWFFTISDEGIVMVHLDTHEVVTAPAPAGVVQRVNGLTK